MPLNHEGKIELLRLARRTLESYLAKKIIPEFQPANPSLLELGGAFVTLEKDGGLRGCIGRLTADRPLFRTVQDMAVQAAISDPRFPGVTLPELSGLEIEISALSPLEILPRERLQDLEVGRHGLVMTSGDQRGVLLPRVPVEHGWDRDTFLVMTCRKAGLPADAWKKSDCRIEIFTADVFSERDFPSP